ncbi:MAG TPA: VIT domain-containing protein, partial [Gammaproteobacteria bacterium]|nr:VIT domain-containing protein [Gammaproteobacteria bacterium]
MNPRPTTNKLLAALGGCTLALVIAACSSSSNFESADSDAASGGRGSGARTEIPAPPPAGEPAQRGDALEEITVTGAPPSDASATQRSAAEQIAAERRRRSAESNPNASAKELERISDGRAVAAASAADLPRAFAMTAPFADLADDTAALARILPGEEVWIISRGNGADEPGPADDAPGTGAMLASLVVPDDRAPQHRRVAEIPLPLEHTDVRARITGYVSTVDVTQQFANPYDQKIEAVYLFPLPEKSAVREFVMTIGERRIRGILREREQAEQIYAQARAQGYQASLLTQHRPNVFEQKVANIEPGHRIDVDIRYFHTLSYNDGWYSFVFPTVVGPRYNPPGSSDPIAALPRNDFAPAGTGVHYLAPHERSGHDISIEVELAPGVAIEEIDSTHDITRSFESERAASVRLARSATIANRDFVLNFRVAGSRTKTNLLTWVDPDTQQGYFTMMMYPPNDLENLRRQPLELVFVLDCSGSMSGAPMQQSKAAILAALHELRPDDTFQIIRFSTNSSQFGPGPVPATHENIRRAEQYVRNLSGTGGTQMIEGIKAALEFPHDPQRLRFVTFLTDGFIGNETEILGAIHARLGAARIFSFGVGSAPNRYLLERMAGVGRGAVAYLGLEDSGSDVMDL